MRSSVACWALIPAISASCDRPSVAPLPTPAQEIQAWEVEQQTASPSSSSGAHRGVVRAVNRFGAAVPTDPLLLQLDGDPLEVSLDPLGYGTVVAPEPGVSLLTGVEPAVALHTFATPWVRPDLHPAWPSGALAPSLAARSQNGLVVADGAELWWSGPHTPPHRVLSAPGQVRGVRSRHADLDGVLDLVVWTADQVFLLRGRYDGGYGWAAGWEAPGFGVGGVDLVDLTGDHRPDLAVAWNRGDDSVLDLWTGDGELGFTWQATEPLEAPAIDLLAQDATARGVAQLTALHAEAVSWSRFVSAGGALVPVGPTMPPLDPAPGPRGRLLPVDDANADSAHEITVVGAERAALIDIATDDVACSLGAEDAQCAPEVSTVGFERTSFFVAGDSNGDRLADLWFIDGAHQLLTSYWLAPLGQRSQGPVLDLPAAGPLGVGDADGDGSPEVDLAAPGRVWRWHGRARPNDTVVSWSARTLDDVIVRARVEGHFGLFESDGDPSTREIVMLTHENADTRIKVVQYTHGGGRASQLGALQLLATTVTPDDLVMCGDSAWFALDGGAWRVDLSDPGVPRLATHEAGGARAVDCVVTPDVIYAAYLAGSRVVLQASGGIDLEPIDVAPNVGDVAIGATADGPVVQTCTGDCSIAFWPYSDQRAGVFAVSDADGTVIDGVPMGPHRGALSVADVDGDGILDLVGRDASGRGLFVHRSTGASFAPVELWHTERTLVGSVGAADATGDGRPELWTLGADGEVRFSAPSPLTP